MKHRPARPRWSGRAEARASLDGLRVRVMAAGVRLAGRQPVEADLAAERRGRPVSDALRLDHDADTRTGWLADHRPQRGPADLCDVEAGANSDAEL